MKAYIFNFLRQANTGLSQERLNALFNAIFEEPVYIRAAEELKQADEAEQQTPGRRKRGPKRKTQAGEGRRAGAAGAAGVGAAGAGAAAGADPMTWSNNNDMPGTEAGAVGNAAETVTV